MKLKELRLSNNLTQQELSEKIGIKQFTYSNYENEKTQPEINQLIKLADFYNVSVDYLIGREEKNGIGFLTEEQINLVKMIKKLSVQNFYLLCGYVMRLLQEQEA